MIGIFTDRQLFIKSNKFIKILSDLEMVIHCSIMIHHDIRPLIVIVL